jgi:chromate reductase, NAD(P)H dehydrogenase (quinone)
MRFLALTGSLRARSINKELLKAAALLANRDDAVEFSDHLGRLPHFNPDLDAEGNSPPTVVADLRAVIQASDALLISCPEYAHGVAGSFKNLLDWLVSGPEMVGKPVCVLSASTSAQFGPAALVETLRTISATVVTDAAITVPVNGRRMTAVEIAAEETLAAVVREALRHIAAAVHSAQTTR